MKTPGVEDFFYIADGSYDTLAAKSIPSYHEAHQTLVAALCLEPHKEFEIMDLGAGTGVTTAYVLNRYPQARVTCVDLSDAMLAQARLRLTSFSDRVAYECEDNAVALRRWPRKLHAVVSAFCLHHLDQSDKREIFALIHERLLPGGRFIMLDLTTFEDSALREVARRHTVSYMRAHVKDERAQSQWLYHWNELNRPDPADRMIEWLRETGFLAESVFRNFEVAVLIGVKI